MQQLTPDPLNDEYAIDEQGRLYQRRFIEHNGLSIDAGYALARQDKD